MDPVSLAIIVTVISLGSALVYLFKADHEGRRKLGHAAPPAAPAKARSMSAGSSSGKSGGKCGLAQPAPGARQSVAKQQSAKQPVPIPAAPTADSALQWGAHQEPANEQHSSAGRPARRPKAPETLASSPEQAEGPGLAEEPSPDELDSAVLLGVFKPPNSKPQARSNQAASISSTPTSNHSHSHSHNHNHNHNHNNNNREKPGRVARKARHLQQLEVGYSSEQLFNLIAASNLSREDAGMAIEALLDRLDSPESNGSSLAALNRHQLSSIPNTNYSNNNEWRLPKSDPLNRLRSMLRDSEIAYATEIQNHELSRARLAELKTSLLAERSAYLSMKEENGRIRKELEVLNIALEQARSDASKQLMFGKQKEEETEKLMAKHEQEKCQLEALLAGSQLKETELHAELADIKAQLQMFEVSNQHLCNQVQELEAKQRSLELQLEQVRSSKHHDDYEACAKISELEADAMRLDKSLKDQAARTKEALESNGILQKSVAEYQLINGRQEEMIKRLRDERHVDELSMKKTLCEMEGELKELQAKLNANSASQDQKLRNEMNQVEKELEYADQREQKLINQMKELREGLATLFPNIGIEQFNTGNQEDWVQHYLSAVKRLAKSVDELREASTESPKGESSGYSTSSPIGNGKTSKAESYNDRDGEKKLMETKLLEMNEYVAKLEKDIQEREEDLSISQYEQQIKELKLHKIKLEAQIKFGLDSLKAEQVRASALEEELSKYITAAQSN